MAALWSRPDDGLLELFEESGRNVQRAGLLLRDMLVGFPEQAGLARDLLLCEQEGDRIAHDIIHRVAEGHGRSPLDSGDVYALATALDDVVDYAEQAADALSLYGIEAPMDAALRMSEVLVQASEQVATALRALRHENDLAAHLVEIHRLENENDRILRDAVGGLFANGIDPMVVIRWKDIFETLEHAVDACETVAHLLEGVTLKRRRRR